jgi:hypothetical protein
MQRLFSAHSDSSSGAFSLFLATITCGMHFSLDEHTVCAL